MDRWYHYFRSFGAGYTQRKYWKWSEYKPASALRFQRLKISNIDTRAASLFTTDNSTDVGAAPSPSTGDNLNFGPAAWTAALAALGTTSTYAAVAIGAAQAVGVLLNNDESESGNTVTYEYEYEYYDGPCEAVHYAKYHFGSHAGESLCRFSVSNVVTYSGAGGIETVYGVYVDPIPDPLQSATNITSTVDADTRPEPGSPNHTDFLVKNNLAKRIAFDDIQIPHLRKLADGSPVYWASNPVVKITTSSGPV